MPLLTLPRKAISQSMTRHISRRCSMVRVHFRLSCIPLLARLLNSAALSVIPHVIAFGFSPCFATSPLVRFSGGSSACGLFPSAVFDMPAFAVGVGVSVCTLFVRQQSRAHLCFHLFNLATKLKEHVCTYVLRHALKGVGLKQRF